MGAAFAAGAGGALPLSAAVCALACAVFALTHRGGAADRHRAAPGE
ncbi:hypothetical protein OHB04_32270 [Streptomyces sp. NBC_01775]|nr:hypothetical protein [Streptomyces sp. NBC_01775]WSB79949.1 hypothetical protein OHB04_32270 [Streptomyces sp. NBC_01775]